MDPARTRLNAATGDLLDFLQLLDMIEGLDAGSGPEKAVPGAPSTAIKGFGAFAKPARLHRLGYQVVVVFGYAAFERFVRDLIILVAQAMTHICHSYETLPGQVREQHLRLTLKAASLQVDRSRGEEPELPLMLGRLLACLNGDQPYALNDKVFADHQANFRAAVTRDALHRVGVLIAEDLTTPRINELLDRDLNGVYARASTVIDDLADRRNQAAHGDEIELLDRATLRAIIAVVRSYSDALANDAFRHLAQLLATQMGNEIGVVQHTWRHADSGQRTVCRVAPASSIAPGQRIVVIGGDTRLATIRSIQINGARLDAAEPSSDNHGVDIGILAHVGERLYAVPQEELDAIEGFAGAELAATESQIHIEQAS